MDAHDDVDEGWGRDPHKSASLLYGAFSTLMHVETLRSTLMNLITLMIANTIRSNDHALQIQYAIVNSQYAISKMKYEGKGCEV